MINPESINLTDFLTRWHGPPKEERLPLPSSCNWLPGPLREWHEVSRMWNDIPVYATVMVPPEEIQISLDGVAVFMTDVTDDYQWAFEGKNPEVIFEREAGDPRVSWAKIPEDIHQALLHRAVMESIFWAPMLRAFNVPKGKICDVTNLVEEVSFRAWDWYGPEHRIFMSNDYTLEVNEAACGSGFDINVSSPNLELLDNFNGVPGVEWVRPRKIK